MTDDTPRLYALRGATTVERDTSQEIAVEGAVERCVRVLLHVYLPACSDVHHVYLPGAVQVHVVHVGAGRQIDVQQYAHAAFHGALHGDLLAGVALDRRRTAQGIQPGGIVSHQAPLRIGGATLYTPCVIGLVFGLILRRRRGLAHRLLTVLARSGRRLLDALARLGHPDRLRHGWGLGGEQDRLALDFAADGHGHVLPGAPQRLDLVAGQLTIPARLEALVGDGAVPAPVQLFHRQTDGREHAPDLALAALVDDDLDEGRLGALLLEVDLRRRREPVLEVDPLPQGAEGAPAHLAAHARDVRLGHAVAGMHEPVGEHAIVGQDDQARGVHVEPPHREQDAPV